jgi:methionyl-tRNA formyltransferase
MTKPSFVFFGTPDRARIILDKLMLRGLTPKAIVTGPDKKIGRKQILTRNTVAQFADDNAITCYQPHNQQELSEHGGALSKLKPDFLLVVAYGQIIPPDILSIPNEAPINVHYSVLPKWRGASPVVQQILHNEDQVGITFMHMVEKLDAGPIYYIKTLPMPTPLPTAGQLATQLSEIAAGLIPGLFENIKSGKTTPQPQNHDEATYCHKLSKADGQVDLEDDQFAIYKKTKALHPWPKTSFYVIRNKGKHRIVINAADFNHDTNRINISSVTPAGKSVMTWVEFTNWLGHDPLLPKI